MPIRVPKSKIKQEKQNVAVIALWHTKHVTITISSCDANSGAIKL